MRGRQKRKLLFVHHGTLQGGAPLSLMYTIQGLADEYEITVGLVRYAEDIKSFYEDAGFRVIDMGWIYCYYYLSASPQPWNRGHTYRNLVRMGLKWFPSKWKSKSFFQKHDFDLIHLNSVTLINTAMVLIDLDIPFIWHVREYGLNRKDIRSNWFRKNLKKADDVIFLSQAEKRSWMLDIDKGTVVHNFVDMSKFQPTDNTSQTKKKANLLFVGGFKAHKGIDQLLEALQLLKNEGFEFVCHMPGTIVGDVSRWQNRIKDMGIESYCSLSAFTTDIRSFFDGADILIFPASKPHFARPVVEAAAMEVPSIASRIDPMQELIVEGETGLLFENGNAVDLFNKIRYILENRDIAKQMGKRGRQYAMENFESDKQIAKIKSIYTKVFDARR